MCIRDRYKDPPLTRHLKPAILDVIAAALLHFCFCILAFSKVLKFEPNNAIILDYQGTLAQYINNGEGVSTL